ncbi:MAG: hypothetical protein J0H15_10660 [Xanthomonadales bacterium]|nr:hypothetical protein [Xanthomonadales bacterium]
MTCGFTRRAVRIILAFALSASCPVTAHEAGGALGAWPLGLIGPAPVGHIKVETLPFFDNNTTAGGTDTINRLPGSCISREHLGGPERIYRLTLHQEAGMLFTVIPQTPEYDPAIYLTDASGSGEQCLAGADAHGPGQRETFAFGSAFVPGETYYLYIDSIHDAATDAAGAAGPYRLEITTQLLVGPQVGPASAGRPESSAAALAFPSGRQALNRGSVERCCRLRLKSAEPELGAPGKAPDPA